MEGNDVDGQKKEISEWEELENLSKDELIIELVRQRWLYRSLKRLIGSLSEDEGWYADIGGQIPPEEWQRKIADYVFPNVEDGGYEDLMTWGVDETVGEALFDEYYEKHFDGNGKRICRENQIYPSETPAVPIIRSTNGWTVDPF